MKTTRMWKSQRLTPATLVPAMAAAIYFLFHLSLLVLGDLLLED
jgi:hypothetical protein